tara:strand:- start:5137 stop:5835 length:699 start_codon:yes stop_codon:yes gene_type:complete
MPNSIKIFFLLSGAILIHYNPATSQDITSSYRFVKNKQEGGIFIGNTKLNSGQFGLGPKSAYVYGGRYSVAFASALAFEGSGTIFKGKRDVIDVRRNDNEQLIGQSTIDLYLFDAKLKLNLTGQRTWRGLQPFVAFGGGMALSSSLERSLEKTANIPVEYQYNFGSKFVGTLAAGLNFHLSSKIMMRLDGVMNIWKIVTPPGWLTTEADLGIIEGDEWVAAQHLSIGTSWRF